MIISKTQLNTEKIDEKHFLSLQNKLNFFILNLIIIKYHNKYKCIDNFGSWLKVKNTYILTSIGTRFCIKL